MQLDLAKVDTTLHRYPRKESSLVMVLQELQAELHHLPVEVLQKVADYLGVPATKVFSVATFYKSFSLQPKASTIIQVCKGTACHVRGAELIHRELERVLGIRAGQTTPDGAVTLETVNCVGACALAPVVIANGVYHPHVQPARVGKIVARAIAPTTSETPSNEAMSEQIENGKNAVQGPATKPSRFSSFEALAEATHEAKGALGAVRAHVQVCGGPGCLAAGSQDIAREIMKSAREAEVSMRADSAHCLPGDALLSITGCQGLCQKGPLVRVMPGDWMYVRVAPNDAKKLVDSLECQQPVESLFDPSVPEKTPRSLHPFYRGQLHQALGMCGDTNPGSLHHYLAVGGFAGLCKVLKDMSPEQVIAEVELSGLRGRGGAGFSTGRKWKAARDAAKTAGIAPYVICNGDEGDPGAFMDRAIMEGSPLQVIEGMMIGAYAVGAQQGFIYVRAEYPLAVTRLRRAIDTCREAGLLGGSVLGTEFSFDIQINTGAGAFVCGESTALMRSIEGKVGEPRAKYERSVARGLNDAPTVLNNVETWALVPALIRDGAASFASVGTSRSKGTKTFSLTGQVQRTGLVEVPMGTTLRQLVFEIGGGMLPGRTFKAVQSGGPSGGCLPESQLDLPVDFDALVHAGSMMGSGGMIVCDNTSCMVDVARYFVTFLLEESCGKCAPCRLGLQQLCFLLTKLCEGRATARDIDTIEQVANTMHVASLCGLGKSASNPVLSTLRYFRNEYDAHVNGLCPAGVCRDLIAYEITQRCTGCQACVKPCPVSAITGQLRDVHTLDHHACTRCGICKSVCKFDAIAVVPSRQINDASSGKGDVI